ncbi:MAG TPA: MFS transporter [Caulobacteraceae bacterium]|jgi:MFS family permease|nr:MFS transporter [Caulobacteraceae bacterium]
MTATSAIGTGEPASVKKRTNIGLVIAASAAGTAFEWYDFFLFVPLAAILSKTFFSGLNETASYVFALGAFAVGFAFRPIGALIFGRIGDRVGRKGTFLITMSLMGFSTFALGLVPSYAQAGILAPVLFIGLRILQGLALGGEWGGAAIYIAEHVDDKKRGVSGAWLGGSAAFGLLGALAVVLVTRAVFGEPAFVAWAWRIPFLFSAFLLAISVWIRLKLHESPLFAKMRDEGHRSERPYAESFLQWPNLKRVLMVLFGIMVAQGAVWYLCFFYASFFMETVIKLPSATVNLVMIALVVASVPLYLAFGLLSDRIGRKPVMLFGMIVTVLFAFPGFHLITRAGNPALDQASTRAPVVVVADPAECSLQFDPVGKSQFRTSCDIAKSTLTTAGVSYQNLAAPAGTPAQVKVGEVTVPSADGRGLDTKSLAALKTETAGRIKTALAAAGYPLKADPAGINLLELFGVLLVFCIGATALYGPQAAALVELFPTRIRYTALSLPYHIGTGWVGGFLPASAFAMVAAKGDIYFGLWYPVVATTVAVLAMIAFLPETKGKSLDF